MYSDGNIFDFEFDDVVGNHDYNPFEDLLKTSEFAYFSTADSNENYLSLQEARKVLDDIFEGEPCFTQLSQENEIGFMNSMMDEEEEEDEDDSDVEFVGIKKPQKKKTSSRKITAKHFPTIFTKKRKLTKKKVTFQQSNEIIDLTSIVNAS